MPTIPEIIDYLRVVVREWWISVPVLVGAIRLYEWLFRHGKAIPLFSPRVRWYIALGGLVVAQFFAYRQLASSSKSTINGLQAKKGDLEASQTRLEATIKDKDQQIQDLKRSRSSPPVSPPPSPLPVSKYQFTQKEVSSTSEDAPFGIEVVIQTNVSVQPARIVVRCSDVISTGTVRFAGVVSFMAGKIESVSGKEFSFGFQTPPFTPDAPLIVTIYSKHSIKAVSVNPLRE